MTLVAESPGYALEIPGAFHSHKPAGTGGFFNLWSNVIVQTADASCGIAPVVRMESDAVLISLALTSADP